MIVPDVKFRDPRVNRSGEIRHEVIGGGIFDSFFRDNFRPEVASVVVSRAVVEVGTDVGVILGQTVLEIRQPLTL